ncbi:DUF2845 domain-containing protein [Modicisalibacter coralii]|uniref:DUF2845 domain-containing protein n=1 Tax=Modicisalibacter coralii TaxID=2304602 RepID=UPI001F266296|nr:DUF2845 domain-containing protein [Halomonas coralii]
MVENPARHSLPLCIALLSAMLSIVYPGNAHAMRCGNALVHEGDLTVDVIRKCGKPDARTLSPATDNKGAVEVEHWVYGPRNGARYYLRFINKKLISIEMAVGPS